MTSIAEILSKYTDEANPEIVTGLPVDVLVGLMNASEGTTVSSKSAKKKGKRSSDPKKPKKPKTSFISWMGDGNRDRIRSELSEAGKSSKMPDVTKEAGRQWKEIGDDEKQPYVEAYGVELAIWKEEMSKYRPVVVESTEISDDLPETVGEGWSSVYENKYLPGYVKGDDGKKMTFSVVDSAISAALSRPECGGVTAERGKKSWRYTLRMGGEGELKESRKGECSWVKASGGAPAPKASGGGPYLSGAGMPDGIEEEVMAKVSEVEDGVEDEVEDVVEDEVDDDGSDEECEVEEFEHLGKVYVYDGDGNIYDPDGDGEVIGKYVDGVAQW